MRSYAAAATLLCGSFFRFFEKSYISHFKIWESKCLFIGWAGNWTAAEWQRSDNGVVVKYSLRPGSAKGQALAKSREKWLEGMSGVYGANEWSYFSRRVEYLISVRDCSGNPLKKIGTESPAPITSGKRPNCNSTGTARFGYCILIFKAICLLLQLTDQF